MHKLCQGPMPLWPIMAIFPVALAMSGYPGVGVLTQPKMCPEFTLVNGTPVRRRYFANDCLVPTVPNPRRQPVHDLNLVFITPGSGAFGDEMTTSEAYIMMAMQQIEDSSLLPGYRLNTYVADSRCSAPDAAANAVRALTTGPTKHGLVGDACSAGCVAVNDVVQYFNILQVSAMCTSAALSDHQRYPFFTRLSPGYKNNVFATRAIMIQWDWHRLGVIHDSRSIDLVGRDILLSLMDEDTRQGDYNWHVLLTQRIATAEEAASAMVEVRARDARVIANIMYEDIGKLLICEAYKQDMTSPHWVQVIVSGWWGSNFLTRFEDATSCAKENMWRTSYGWLGVAPHGGVLMQDAVHGLSGKPIAEIQAQYERDCMKTFGTLSGCDFLVSPYTYDSIWHYAALLHKYLIDEGHSYDELNTRASRERLFNLSLQADYIGLTGRVRQYNRVDPSTSDYKGSFGDREGPSQIRQIRGSVYEPLVAVGHRFPDDTLTWYQDVIWSADDPLKRVPCAATGVCQVADGWVPADSFPAGCASNTVWSPQSGCSPCSTGEFANATVCLPCPAGMAADEPGQVQCAECSPGRFSNLLGAETCIQCASGRYVDTASASACKPCEQGSYQGDIGSTACHACGGLLVTPLHGAYSIDQCICPAGTYRPLMAEVGSCEACPEGIECPLGSDLNNQDALPVVQEGYYTDMGLSVYKCLDDGRRCRRGPIGSSCASGRYGRVCWLCEDGKAPVTDGTCEECESMGDSAPLVALAGVSCLFFVAVYYVFDRTDIAKQDHRLLLLAMTVSLIVTMLQQMGSLATASIAWPGPMNALFNALKILAFDVEALKMNCMVQPRPLASFTMRMLMFASCVVFFCLLHILRVCWKHSMHFRARNHILVSGLGTICLIFYVTIFISVLIPLQCARNPNRQWTLKTYPSVVCWDGSEEHTWMLGLAFVSALVPVGFLARCCVVVAAIPRRIREGNVVFLRSYAFLFFRYKPTAYWFSLCHLIRSLLVALTTVMPVASLQVLFMQCVLLLHLVLVCTIQPWRIDKANSLEALLTLAMLFLLCCSALIAGESGGAEAMAWTFTLFACVSLLSAVAYGMQVACHAFGHRRRKSFHFFICHHKLATGCMARLLNVELAAHNKRAFIDTDDLRDLDKLFDVVATRTETLIVLCSKLVLLRPWCVGEIVTATNWKVHIVKVLRPDYEEPSMKVIEDYESIVGDEIAPLVQCGIDPPLICETLSSFAEVAGWTLPASISPGTIHTLSERLRGKKWHGQKVGDNTVPYVPQPENVLAQIILITDNENMEASCTGLLLVSVLVSHMADADIMKTPYLLTEEVEFPMNAEMCLLLCMGDCLGRVAVLQRLKQALEERIAGMPVLGDETFVFPGADFVETRESLLKSVSDEPEKLGRFIAALFQTIAVTFQPASYGSTMTVIIAKAKEIAARMSSHVRARSETVHTLSISSGVGSSARTLMVSHKRTRNSGSFSLATDAVWAGDEWEISA